MSIPTTAEAKTSICEVCNATLSKYCCPKCNILYCSLNCYRSGNHLECSEGFYRENVIQEINLNTSKDPNIIKILQKSYENEVFLPDNLNNGDPFELDENLENLDSDDENYTDIAQRLEGVNLDNAEQVWEKLTEDEKQDFEAFVKSEDVTELIPLWEPWWMHFKILEDESDAMQHPPICKIKKFSEITVKSPSENVKYNLVNIISAYAFMARYFNGEHFDFPEEAVSLVVTLSLTLKCSENFMDIETAITSVEQECINCNWIVSSESNFKNMRDDIYKIFRGPTASNNKFYIICALSDLRSLVKKSLKPIEKCIILKSWKKFETEHSSFVKVESSDVKKCIKKIDYYLAFTKYYYVNDILK